MVRGLLAVLAGAALGLGCVVAFDALSHVFYPGAVPPDMANADAFRAYMEQAPAAAKAVLLIGWLLAAFIAASIATIIARGLSWPGYVAGGLLWAATASNAIVLPHPQWMVVAAFVLPAVSVALVMGLRRTRT
jgi:hypothetical protein